MIPICDVGSLLPEGAPNRCKTEATHRGEDPNHPEVEGVNACTHHAMTYGKIFGAIKFLPTVTEDDC